MSKKQILIASYDLEIGGAERSLLGLLSCLNSDKYDIDLLLFSQTGEFMQYLNAEKINLLPEIPKYKTFRMSIAQILKKGHIPIASARLAARFSAAVQAHRNGACNGYAMQKGWDFSRLFLPTIKKEYDTAISFLWPHHCVAYKVKAKTKIAWIHTDYRQLQLDKKKDLAVWQRFDLIAAVSDENRAIFNSVYPELSEKTITIENIIDAAMVKRQSKEFSVSSEMDSSCTKLLTVGRYCEAKAFDEAVRACKILLERKINVKWYAIGYGGEENKLKKLVNDFGIQDKFIFLGKKISPYPYVAACDIYVQPSRYEGKAVTVREAQILEKPVLITNFASAHSQLADGYDGIICEMGPENIADAIMLLMDNPDVYEKIVTGTKNTSYENKQEVDKLYKIFDSSH